MQTSHEYELLDFGNERKLERFGQYILDRPSPSATGKRRHEKPWKKADARFELRSGTKAGPERGLWRWNGKAPSSWPIRFGDLQFELKPTDFGHVGVFPEQAENWNWIRDGLHNDSLAIPPTVLNLFAYTGGSTLAAASAGAAVTHVDAAANVVAWARQNAELSGMTDAPIRWIVEDALKFAQRELKRGRRYDAVILDPPSYGHGPNGEVWKIDEHLPELLSVCRELTCPQPSLLLLTCHATLYNAARLKSYLADAGFDVSTSPFKSGDLCLTSVDGRQLNSGNFVRFKA